MRAGGVRGLAVACMLLVACGTGAPDRTGGALPPGVAVRVGPVAVSAEHVARVAAAQHTTPAQALDVAASDAVLARAALAQGLDRVPEVEAQIRGELARRALRRLLAEGRSTPPLESELREAEARKWLDVDRPEGFRTVHAVVQVDLAAADAPTRARARAVADAIRAAVLPVAEQSATMPLLEGAPHPTDRQPVSDDPDPLSAGFRRAAAAVPRDGFEVTVQPLPAISADARVLAPGGMRFHPEFAAAAAALPARGALSPVTSSPSGLHVILLLERTPALGLSPEERQRRLEADVVNERARAAEKRLLGGLRPRAQISPDAPGLMDLVVVEP